MPRPNQPRSIATEQALARRLAYERERRGMSYDGLASRMIKAGCPIQASGLYKIEKAGRRITVDELVALAMVFEMDVPDLLQPVEMLLHADIARAETAEQEAWTALTGAIDRVVHARSDRAALYKRASSGDDENLSEAVDAFWRERKAAMQEAAKRSRGSLARLVKEFEARALNISEEERAESERARRLEDAMDPLFDAIREVADPDGILGDS